MKEKKLLVISKYLPEYTGAAYRLHSLYKRLPDQELEVLCTSTSKTESSVYEYEGVKVKRVVFPVKLTKNPGRLLNALKIYYEAFFCFTYLIKSKPTFLHIAGYSGATMAALLYGRIYKVPRLVELVTGDATPFQYLPGFRYPKFLSLDVGTVIIAISDRIAERSRERGLIKNLWCRPNPIDEKKFKQCDHETRIALRHLLSPFNKDDVVICMVAKFMPQKNQVFMIDVMKELPKNYKLLLAGPRVKSGVFQKRDEEYFNKILKNINDYGLKDRIHIHDGFVDAADYMKASDIYVMPQYDEGLGTPMLEAIACGVPVVANRDEPAFCEWIKDGKNGYLASLQIQEWCDTLKKTMKISSKEREESSLEIHTLASMDHCDKKYLSIFKALKNTPVNEEVVIENVR